MINESELWQVEVNNQIFEANIEELCQWIAEGALLPNDKVRHGNLRWREANRVPTLLKFFNAKERGLPFPVLQNVVDAESSKEKVQIDHENFLTTQSVAQIDKAENKTENFAADLSKASKKSNNGCAIHAAEKPLYVCESCAAKFCKTCPKSYGSNVKICPLCGAMCKSIQDLEEKKQKDFEQRRASAEGFGFADFTNALAYPFKFKTSLIFGAVMFVFFTLGQTASAMGGIVLLGASVFCAMLANTLTFGILANTIDNFLRGNPHADFMPRFDDFSLWEDVIHPFFLSLGAYLVSFGLLIALIAGAFYYAVKSFAQIETEKQKIVSTVLPGAAENFESAEQIPNVNRVAEQLREKDKPQKNGALSDPNEIARMQQNNADDARKIEELLNQKKTERLDKNAAPNAEAANFGQTAADVLRLSMIFSIPIFLAFLWGVFYFPVACAVAGYTRSFAAVINPLVGLDTIKRLGANYAKILVMFLLVGVFTFAATALLQKIFAPFDLPRIGNLPVKIVGGLMTFYFSIVFSVTLGFALYKSADRLNLHRG